MLLDTLTESIVMLSLSQFTAHQFPHLGMKTLLHSNIVLQRYSISAKQCVTHLLKPVNCFSGEFCEGGSLPVIEINGSINVKILHYFPAKLGSVDTFKIRKSLTTGQIKNNH